MSSTMMPLPTLTDAPRQGSHEPKWSALTGQSTEKLALRTNDLHERFVGWRDRHSELSNKAIARRLGYSETMLSRYLNDKFVGDLDKFEATLTEFMIADALRADLRQTVEPFETEATRQVARGLEIIRSKPQIGMLLGDAGYGKTCGIQLYMQAHAKSTLLFTASPLFGAGAAALVHALWKQIDTRGYHRRVPRGEYLVDKLRDSHRMVIVDDAHELHEAGRRAVKSFFDLTGCPVALVGNPRIRQQWAHDDQNGSRTGYVGTIRLLNRRNGKVDMTDLKHLRPAVRQFLQTVWPGGAEDVEDLALQVATREGHLRALWMQCSLAMHLIELDKKHGSELHRMARERGIPLAEQAFRTAHGQLVRSYELKAEG